MGTNITGIGNANAIGFKSRVTGGAYFPPELKDALVGVWSAYGKSNDSTDRNIIKNKIKDRGGDFIISNAAFKLNSGFGGFVEDFTSWDRIDSSTAEISNDGSKIKCINTTLNVQYLFNSINRDIPSFKVKISNFTKGDITYYYRKEDGIEAFLKINPLSVVNSDKVIELPKSYNTVENGTGGRGGFYSSNINIGVTITQIPSFEGAFVTDGIDDLITSTKTVQEMLGGSNEITVVSMMANLDSRKILCNSNYSNTNGYNVRNTLEPNGVITMLGYTDKNGTTNNLNLIMGDKDSIKLVDKVNFNSDYVFYPAQYYKAYYQVAWYWTFIANRVLTEDEINLVIEKYNLDRPGEIVKPDVYYDIKRQKITNENHSAFDDKLIDYSGNGYDAKLYNFGWKEDSGIGKYETDFTDWKKSFKVTSFDSESIKFTSDVSWVLLYHPSSIGEDIPSFKVRIKLYGKGTLYYNYITQEGKYTNVAVKSEIFETPICYNTKYTGEKGVNVGFTLGVISGECSGTITQIPEYENALVLDGVDDYGKVTGLPILKDYTVVTDREILANIGAISSKNNPGAFLETAGSSVYSFGQATSGLKLIFTRSISYLSKYSYCGQSITAGAAEDGTDMWLGTIRDNDSRFFNGAIYFLMLFPYSMSEFLIERQIEKIKGGTLYPNQVEFRPVIPEDENITRIDYFVVDSGVWKVIKPGDYVDVGAKIVLNVYTKLPYKIEKVSSPAFTGMSVRHSTELNIFDVEGYIKDKTPQKIKLTLAINEDIVQWNPAITSNLLDSFTVSSWYLNGWDNTLTVGTWIKKTDRVFFKATFKTELYGLETATFGGTECVVSKADNWSDSKNIWDIRMLGTVGDLSQIFNLDVYELIRFEDIVQPYPVLLRFKDENGNEVSWGGKFKVGSTITRIASAADSNLLPNIYNIFGLLLNGNQVTSYKVIVEKTMVFKAKSAYIFDNNEPKCILSPRLLRIPNSSYKILGYIPDISGHGNNGVIHNSAYAEGSGVNEDGSYQLDGVDDFVTIPTTVGGKQVLMKVNWDSPNASILYDQRGYNNEFAIYNGTNDSDGNPIPAYQGRNNGQTYIDGILNSNIKASELRAITHNITITNELSSGANKTYPIIGSSKSNAYFVNMALYDFMLFDEISTDDKILELNEYIGLSGNIFEFNPPTFTIDLPMAIKNIKVYQGGNEISPGYLYPNKDTEFEVYVSLNDGKYAVDTITVDDVEITKDRVVGEYNIFKFTLNGSSEQKITIHSYEYIMYEDIIQPYPSFVKLENLDRTHTYTWGDKLRIGDTIRYNSSKNLLEGAYTLRGQLECNGVYVFDNNQQIVVTKEMVFAWSHSPVWTIGNSAPKCVFSPSKLRIPNSSYKYLGYIPDISGNGNNGAFTNFAFSGMSGANGYPYDYNNSSFWADSSLAKVVSGELVEYFAVKNSTGFSNITSGVYKGKIKVTGVTKAISENKISRLRIYSNSTTDNELIDITQDGNYNIDIKGVDDANRVFFYAIPSNPNDTAVVRLTEPIYIEQVGNYEGSICFDGVDDYMDIPSLSIGGKQVLMKTNWLKSPTLLYDQRASGSFAILTTKEDDATNPRIAYQARNQDGKTYIDGIENNYIETYSLKGITHNITVTNPSAGSGVVPVIGANTGKSSSFAKMALYDFMLFDEVSTNEEIKQLNDIVGIEGNYVQRPPYYWDAYGKTNSDDDRSTIQQRGTAVGDYDLTNNNFAYEGMSGYNGYPAVFGTNKTYANLVPNDGNFILTSSHNIINVTKFDTSYGLLYSHIKLDGKLTSRNIDYPSYKIKVTGLGENFGLHYSYLESSSDTTVKGFEINNDGIYIIPKSFASDGSLTSNSDWIGFIFTGTAPESCNVTIEVLPEYENGLVYDGVDDYSENTSIPAFTDYTYIIKYEDFNNPNTGSCIQRKGSIKAGGGAFVQDHIYRGTKYQYNFGINSNIHKDDSIAFCTRTNYNGTAIPSGNNTDDTGFTIGKFDGYRKMVFYKEMLYPRTVNMLTINMIKNMMAEDGIIDIQGKLFTDKFTGDFNLDFNKDFLIGN